MGFSDGFCDGCREWLEKNVSKSALGRYIRQVNKLDVGRGMDTTGKKKGMQKGRKKLELTSEGNYFSREAQLFLKFVER